MWTLEVFKARAFRLALGFALTIAVATAAAFAFIYWQVSSADMQQVGAILVDEASKTVNESEADLRAALEQPVRSAQLHEGITVRLAQSLAHSNNLLEAAGTTVISLEPGAESRRAMGLRAMAEDRSPRVIEAAYEETRRRVVATPFLASLGDPLAAAHDG